MPAYLHKIPGTGLVRQRQFFYACKGSKLNDRGPWFNGAAKLIGNAPYVIAVPFVPGGTLVYRPTGQYEDLRAVAIGRGWAHTNID